MFNLKKIPILSLVMLAVSAFWAPAPADAQITTTTTTQAISNTGGTPQGRFVYLTSATNVLAPGLNQPQGGLGSPTGGPNETGLYIDQELMRVNSVSGLVIGVQRGVQGTRTSYHVSGATVYSAPFSTFVNFDQVGACNISGTSVTTPSVLPKINTNNGKIFGCPTVGPNAGQWVQTGVTAPPASYLLTDNTAAGITAMKICHARYSFAVDGGAVSTITPATGCTIPISAVIYKVVVDCIATTVGSTGNISVGLSAGGAGTGALWAATARASCSAGTFFDGVPLAGPTASLSNATYIKMSAAGNVTFTIATNALTAGILDIDVFYYDLQA